MELTEAQRHDFDVALNEATIVGVSVAPEERSLSVTVAALALPAGDGPAPEDPRVRLDLRGVGRVAASLRAEERVEPFGLERLSEVVASFGQQPVYGWRFLDIPAEEGFARWADRLSLDWAPAEASHTLDLFQEEGAARELDLRIWFDELRVFGPDGAEIAFADFTAAGVRWWAGLYADDPRTAGHGIVRSAP